MVKIHSLWNDQRSYHKLDSNQHLRVKHTHTREIEVISFHRPYNKQLDVSSEYAGSVLVKSRGAIAEWRNGKAVSLWWMWYRGSCEFAKRYWCDFLQKDLSPISIRALTGCRSIRGLVQIANKYDVKTSALLRLAGAGYRVRSRMLSSQTRRWERLKVVASKPYGLKSLPLEMWLGWRARLFVALLDGLYLLT